MWFCLGISEMSKRRCVFLSCYLVDHKFLSWCEHDSKDRQIEKSECKKCDYSIICKGGCPFRSHYLKGDPKLPDPWCLNQPLKKKYLDYPVSIKNFEKEEVIC